jgi:hypothetical protein
MGYGSQQHLTPSAPAAPSVTGVAGDSPYSLGLKRSIRTLATSLNSSGN